MHEYTQPIRKPIVLSQLFLTLLPYASVYLDFDDNSRDWALLLNASIGWELSHGCTETAGTGPCDDVSGGGKRYFFLFRLFFSLVGYSK